MHFSGVKTLSGPRIWVMGARYGIARVGSSMSVMDFLSFGSTLSVRAFSRMGSTLSVTEDRLRAPFVPTVVSQRREPCLHRTIFACVFEGDSTCDTLWKVYYGVFMGVKDFGPNEQPGAKEEEGRNENAVNVLHAAVVRARCTG